MHIEHIAIWTSNIERLKEFYIRYFNAIAGEQYNNPKNNFISYFLSFSRGPRLELMQMPTIPQSKNDIRSQFTGFIHMAFSVGSKQKVDELTEQLRNDGYLVMDTAHETGDGYYESCVLDPDGNRIEITV